MESKFIFVGHQHGEFEGNAYDNVILSNGIRTFKVKNKTGKTSFPDLTPEKDTVLCTFAITPGKNDVAVVTLTSIAKKT